MAREQFTFYRSFWEACKVLSKKEQLLFLSAVCAYALEEESIPLTGAAAASFLLVKPVLDKASKRAASGKQGGSKPKAKSKQTESKPKANAEQTAREKEKEKEIEDDSPPFIPPEGDWGFGKELSAALRDWLCYKAERRQAYSETGLRALGEQVGRLVTVHGEAAVAAVIRESMASGYAGLVWSRLEAGGKPGAEGDLSWMKEYL